MFSNTRSLPPEYETIGHLLVILSLIILIYYTNLCTSVQFQPLKSVQIYIYIQNSLKFQSKHELLTTV